MLTLSANQTSFAVGDQITFTFRFENRYGTPGDKITETYFSSIPEVDLYGSGNTVCTLEGDPGLRWNHYLTIAYSEILACSFPYSVTDADSTAGVIRASVTLDVPGVGTTTSNEVVIPADEP